MGWKFLFKSHIHPTNIYSFTQWLEELENPNKVIYNEYNEIIKLDSLLEKIESKQKGRSHADLGDRFFIDKDGYEFSNLEFS